MSHTNSTTNYGLPQFLTSDKPAWLTDINNAFSDIDTAVYNAQTKANTAYTDAGNAQLDATTAINNAAAADAKGSGAIASIEVAFDPTTIYSVGARVMYNSLLYRCIVAVTTPGPWTGSDNWERITVDNLISTTDSKIGNLTSLSTSDKSSTVNAINEVNGKANAIQTDLTVTDVELCPGAHLARYGKVVMLWVQGATAANLGAARVPEGYRPRRSSAYINNDSASQGGCAIDSNGNITIGSSWTGATNIWLSGIWIAS